jgi:hypothetical protein
MRMLFDYYETDRMIVCMDPAKIELLQDFAADRSTTRVLELDCTFSDDYLKGHAVRVGLAGARTSTETFARLIPTIRNDMLYESDRIRDAGFEHYTRMRQDADPDQNAQALAAFLSVSPDTARDIAESQSLFAD